MKFHVSARKAGKVLKTAAHIAVLPIEYPVWFLTRGMIAEAAIGNDQTDPSSPELLDYAVYGPKIKLPHQHKKKHHHTSAKKNKTK